MRKSPRSNGLAPRSNWRSATDTPSAMGSTTKKSAAMGGTLRPGPWVSDMPSQPSAKPIMSPPAEPRNTRAAERRLRSSTLQRR